MNQKDFITTFRRAWRVGTPIIAIETPDPAATIALLVEQVFEQDTPLVQWDSVRGWTPVNAQGKKAIEMTIKQKDVEALTGPPLDSLKAAAGLPPGVGYKNGSVLFVHGAGAIFDSSGMGAVHVQAARNLRDAYKSSLRTLVLIGAALVLPPELANDVLLLDEPLPDDVELGKIVKDLCSSSGVKLKDATLFAAIDALRGLAAFPAEQATAMSINGELDIQRLWERKRRMISETPGLSVWAGGERLDDIGGNQAIKDYARMILEGKNPPRVIVFIDEIDKSIPSFSANGGAGDLSGVSMNQLQQLLTYMENRRARGLMFLGPPGAGKSAIAKAIGNEAGIPTIALDLGGMKGSLVGLSELRLRTGLKVIDAVGGGRALFIATCNREAALPPELRRRFTRGSFFFDLPDAAERDAIWPIWLKQTGLKIDSPRPDDRGWTGAEIRQACEMAAELDLPLADMGRWILPVSKSAGAQIDELRKAADGRFLSASHEGHYRDPASIDEDAVLAQRPKRRLAGEFGKEN